jgi:hypothetical protein
MTYKEFKNTYKWLVKNYPDTTSLYGVEGDIITVTETHYIKQGTTWKETETETRAINATYYLNTVDAVPFFRGLGGHERITKNYTRYGLIPTEISSTSPDGKNKTVRRFKF